MFREHCVDTSEVHLYPLTEDELAEWNRSNGDRIISKFGRYWKETVRGFYQPLHCLAALTADEARKPTRLCWGYQATLCERDNSFANGYIPVNILPKLFEYDESKLSANRRYHLRRCRRRVEIVSLSSADALDCDGYRIYSSVWKRKGWEGHKTRDEYRRFLRHLNKGVILASVIDGRIEGYLTGFAVGSVAYLFNIVIGTEALKHNAGTGLIFEFIQICRRSDGVRQLVHGLHRPENCSLTTYKTSMGFEVTRVPSITHMKPAIARYMRWRQPYKYYRLTGTCSEQLSPAV